VSNVEVCQYLNKTASFVGFDAFFKVFAKSIPVGFVHACPYSVSIFMKCLFLRFIYFSSQGDFILNDIRYDESGRLHIMPDGMYKVKIRCHDAYDENIFTVTITIEKYGTGNLDF
jgi:hypothetical protein